MRAFWSDPYLWVHLAGLAVVPVLLEVCLVGLAMGDPLLPAWVEILVVAIAGIAPILWMQWQRPFSIYSLVAVAITPSQLTDDQRRILKIFKSQESRILAAIAAGVLFLVLVKVYALAPIATTVAPQIWGGRLAGLIVAAIAFLLVNLFVQVPVSVLRALAVSQTAFAETIPYPSEQVGRSFSLLGIGVKQILPPMEMEPPRVKSAPPAPPVSPLAEEMGEDLWEEPIAPAASLGEPSPEDSVSEMAASPEGETANIDAAAIAESDVWEASESVEEIAERDGVVGDDTAVEDAIAQQPDLPAVPEPEGIGEPSVEPPLQEDAEPAEDSAPTPDAQGEEATVELTKEPDSVHTLDQLETSGEHSSDDDSAMVETEGAMSLDVADAATLEEADEKEAEEIEHQEDRGSEDALSEIEVTSETIETPDPSIEWSEPPEGDAVAVNEPSDEPNALAFDDLFDETQDAEGRSESVLAEETAEVDSDPDLISTQDAPPQFAADDEHHG